MRCEPLSPVLGAEVHGVNVASLSDNDFNEIRTHWNAAGGLLVVRDQQLSPQQQTDFSRRFGALFGEADFFQDSVKPFLHPDFPTIYRVSNKKSDAGDALGRARAGSYWHSDVSFRQHPAMASLLYGIEIPAAGGDTLFASQTAAFAALSQAMQDLLCTLTAVHDFRVAARSSGSYAAADVNVNDFDGQNQFVHPVVIEHPETAQPALFVNAGFTSHLQGFSAQESQLLLEFLYEHSTRPEFCYRHRWQANDLVIWDNRATQHLAIQDYSADRYLHRSTVLADSPVAYARR